MANPERWFSAGLLDDAWLHSSRIRTRWVKAIEIAAEVEDTR